MKKLIYLTSLVGLGLFVNSCSLGYVATEPVYVESVRPPRPSNLHIWIDGDYVYNRQSRAYVRNAGYWERPSQNRTYVTGRWQSNQHGKYWEKGRWQNNKGQPNKNSRNRRQEEQR